MKYFSGNRFLRFPIRLTTTQTQFALIKHFQKLNDVNKAVNGIIAIDQALFENRRDKKS